LAILEPFALAIGILLSYVYDFTLSYGFAIAILTVIINVIITVKIAIANPYERVKS
jgi:hypothetical protein